MTDPRCDYHTLSPVGAQTITAGSSLTYRCSHVVLVAPGDHTFTNVGSASGVSPQHTNVGPVKSSVVAKISTRVLDVKTLPAAKVQTPATHTATFTG